MIAKVQSLKSYFLIKEFLLCFSLSIVLSLFSKVAIYLPFSPIPLATQSSMVLLMAAILGRKRAVATVGLFLFQGLMGLPVFAGGLAGGIFHLMGPTGGYLIGYLVAAYVTGLLTDRTKEKTHLKIFYSMLLGNLVIYFFGVFRLSLMLGLYQAILCGLIPFILGDILKLLVGQRLLKKLF